MLQVRTLGGLRQANDGGAKPLRRKPLALLSYVARRGPRAVTRTELATLFWGERGEERARQSLRQALLELKQVLSEGIDVDADSVRIAPDAVELDLVAFERDLAEGRVQEAVGRWAGDFFEGAEDIGGDGFRRWIENERASLHRQLGTAMEKLIGDAELAGDWPGAAAWAQRWASALPFDEAAHLRLIEALRMSGRTSEALKTHAAFVTRVRTALDVEPSAEFLRLGGGLADGARDELTRRSRGSTAVHSPSFVGRAAVMAELADAWRTASAETPLVVVIESGAGAGLTRVCEELIARVGEQGVVLTGRGAGTTTELSAAASLFEGIRTAEGSAGAPPEALAEVARLVPSLTSEFRFLPAALGDEAALRDGVVQTLAAIGEERPVLIVFDDAHLADDASSRLVASIAQRLTGRVMMVVTVNDAERMPNVNLASLRAARGVRQIRLTPLTPAEVEAMLESMVALEPSDRHTLAQRLHQETRGVPHDVQALITALVDESLLVPEASGGWRVSPALGGRALPIPSAVRDRVKGRLERLSPPARSIADAIAILGAPADGAVAGAVAGLKADESEAALGELKARRVIHESAADGGGWQFGSRLVARAVGALLSASRREALHARAAEVLTERDMASTAERSLLPYHLARAARARTGETPAIERTRLPGRRTRRFAWIGGAVVALGVLVGLALRGDLSLLPHRAPPVPIVALGRIADYRERASSNVTKPLTDMIATNLGRVGRLRVVSSARMYELVGQSGRPGDTSDATLVGAARRAGATELVDGALYARDDGGFRLDLRRVALATGNIQKTYSVTGATLFDLADSGTARIAADFGETRPLGSIADVTTRSLSAYRLYEQGLRAYYASDLNGAKPLFEAALKDDSTFAMAAYYSAISTFDNPREVIARLATAARLAARTSDRERLTILAQQAFLASDPSLGAIAETLSVRYPDEVEGYYFTGLNELVDGVFLRAILPLNRVVAMDSLSLTGSRALCYACDALRQIVSGYQIADSLSAAERETRRWIRLQPQSPVPWRTLADVMSQMGRPAEALAALDREGALDAGRGEETRVLNLALHRVYAGDFDQADRLLQGEFESGSPTKKKLALWYQSISFRQQGRLNDAIAASRRHRAMAMADYPHGIVAARHAAPTEALAEAQVLYEMGRYAQSAALFDSVSRWMIGDESRSHNAHARAWAMAHAANGLAVMRDTAGLSARIDTIEALGAESGLGRDRLLHHHVRGLLLVARGQDAAAAEEFRRAIWSWNFGYTRTNMALAAALTRLGRVREAIAALQPALRGSAEASNFYVTRTEIHEALGDAWAKIPGAAARDSSRAHYGIVARAWKAADSTFAARRARAEQGAKD